MSDQRDGPLSGQTGLAREAVEDAVKPKIGITPRSYQLEMLEESLKRNIIVAMDTGSGKTAIAIMRMQAELENVSSDNVCWFCVPTVALADQQHKAITTQLPMYFAKVFAGRDNCEFWNEKTWVEALKGVKIIVSTHRVGDTRRQAS